MITVICPKCNSAVFVDETKTSCFCTYCGSAMSVTVSATQNTSQNVGETFLERGLLILEGTSPAKEEKKEKAKEIFISGLSFDSNNTALLFALCLCSVNSSYAERYFKANNKITAEEEKIIERLLVSAPYIIEKALIHLYFNYRQFDRLKNLYKTHPEVFAEEKILGYATAEHLKNKDFIKLLLTVGIDINNIFRSYLKKNFPISSGYYGVEFEERRLPLDVFEMYLDFGLDVNFKTTICETYIYSWGDTEESETIKSEIDLYSFFEVFQHSSSETEKDYMGYSKILSGRSLNDAEEKGRRRNSAVSYQFEYKNARPFSYMQALINHGYTPKPQLQKKKRRFPWF